MESCDKCTQLVTEEGIFKKVETPSTESVNNSPLLAEKDRVIRELELELAQTKLALVESECRVGDLTHELNGTITELSESKNTWFQKTLTSLREVAAPKKEGGKDGGGGVVQRSYSKENMVNKENGAP